MASPFSIHRSHFSTMNGSAQHDEVRAHTESDEEAQSILRSIERLGNDPSIWRFEMTPANRPSYQRATRTTAWSVRAVRP